jgi:CRISPR-associated protein Cas5h
VLVFDIWADYAHFKKYFTTMSPLSFSIPPRTVIAGMIGAIIGIDKQKNPEFFSKEKTLIALKINQPIKKTKITMNNIKAVSMNKIHRFENHKPTNYEFIKDCSYRIFVSVQETEIQQKIKAYLERHASYYTLNMGISACLANYAYIGEFDLNRLSKEAQILSDTIVPTDCIEEIDFSSNLELQKCKLPNQMKNDREVTEYREFLYEVNGGRIPVQCNNLHEMYQLNIQGVEHVIHPM